MNRLTLDNLKVKSNPNLLIAILILILTLLYIFIPFKSTEYTYEWQPKIDGAKTRLTLLELEPKNFEITIPCIATSNDKQWIFEATGGPAFLFEADSEFYYLTTGRPRSGGLVKNIFSRPDVRTDCESVIKFDSSSNQFNIESLKSKKTFSLSEGTQFFFSSLVKWNEKLESDNFTLSVTTKSLIGAEKTWLKTFLLIVILSILGFNARGYYNLTRLKQFFSRIYYDRFTNYAFLTVIFAMFTVAPMADDGLYLIEARLLSLIGNLIQFQYPVVFPTGNLHAFVNGISSHFIDGILYTRIIPGFVLILIWILINQINNALGLKSNISKSLMFSLWVLYVFSFGLTLRPEPYVALLFLGLIFVLSKNQNSISISAINYSFIATALALSIHQSGFILLFACIPLWIRVIKDSRNLRSHINIIYYALIVSILIFFQNSSLFLYFKRLANFQKVNEWPQPFTGDFKWGYPPYMEYMRVLHLKLSTPSQFLFVSLTFLVSIYLLSNIKYFRKESYFELISLTLIAAPFGLILAPSKWSGHYAALLPVLFIGLMLIMNKSRSYVFVRLLFLSACLYALFLPWKNGGSDTLNLHNNFRDFTLPQILEIKSLFAAIIFILFVTLLLISKYSNYIKSKQIDVLLSLIVIMTPMFQIAPNLIDSFNKDKGWTFSRQMKNELFKNQETCGIYEKSTLINLGIDYKVDLFTFNQESYSYFPCLQPNIPDNGIWTFPNFSVGGIPVWDQQRLAYEASIDLIYCPTNKERSFDDEVDRCVYRWNSLIPNMKLKSMRNVWVF